MRSNTWSILGIVLLCLADCRSHLGESPSGSEPLQKPIGDRGRSKTGAGSSPSSSPATESSAVATKAMSPNELQLDQTCGRPVKLIERHEPFLFAARSGCSFGIQPHLPAQAGGLQAYASNTITVPLPAAEELCSVQLRVDSPQFHFKDVLSLQVQGRVVYTSHRSMLESLTQVDGFSIWNPEVLYGQQRGSSDQGDSCLQQGGDCTWPRAEQEGPVHFTLKVQDSVWMKAINRQQELLLQLAVWGDKDETDCSHTALSGELSLYSLRSKR